MKTKAENPVSLLRGEDAPTFVEAYFEFCHLKQLYRQGWLRCGVPEERCESVAEHSFGVALLAWWLADAYYPELDAGKVLRMGLLHDFGEVYAGDFIPRDNIPAAEKRQREAQSARQVLTKLPNGEVYLALWEEFECGDSPEARFVRQVDRLEMGLQAGVYERGGFSQMEEFFASSRQSLSEWQLIDLLNAVDRPSSENP